MGLSVLPLCRELLLRVTFESLQGNEALSRMDEDIGIFANRGPIPEIPLEFQVENSIVLRCIGNVRIHLQTKQGNGPSSR